MNKRRYAQRKHIVQSFDNLLYQLHVLGFFNSNVVGDPFPLTTLLIRCLAQSQCSKPRDQDPAWSLRIFFGILLGLHGLIMWNHATAPASDRVVILDFIGTAFVPSKVRLITFDLFIMFLQMLLTIITYETSLMREEPRPDPHSENVGKPHPPYALDLHFSSVVARLRTPPTPAMIRNLPADGLPLPNTTPWPLPAVGLRVLLGVPPGRTGRNTETNEQRGGRIPGGLDG
ncbi:DUF1746 domain-containing protein [Mycena indigotica]|uniref:DUF1746 domain-containing protein n=1 Tax=Mycena indigotica TaxID=2126181 RepID=A0A8H6TF40_9AGAR|nr:DUF1746 domain-containing protein [Mycena indigotica]KAF7315607.1 DUF1746 domain-containing protein [Mycena indigotica]